MPKSFSEYSYSLYNMRDYEAFFRLNINKLSYPQMAVTVKAPRNMVECFCREELGIVRNQTISAIAREKRARQWHWKKPIIEELEALQSFNYKGVMMDSVIARINHLKERLES